jgi:hypothetical protein
MFRRLTIGRSPLQGTTQLFQCKEYLNKHIVCETPYIGPCKYTSGFAVYVIPVEVWCLFFLNQGSEVGSFVETACQASLSISPLAIIPFFISRLV